VTSQRLRAELAESRSHLEAKKQDVGKLQRLMEDLQTRLSELTVGQSSREQQQAKEVDRLQAMLAHMEREIQNIRYVSVFCIAFFCLFVCVGPCKRVSCSLRLIVHTPCAFSVPTLTARRLHVTTTLEILAAKCGNCWARNCLVIWPKVTTLRYFRDLLHATNLRHGTDGFTSPLKEVVLTIFSP
jgi:hypothetical protein